ncbi:MAG: S1 family peptidase [Defluviitaleaceae bacterium]|nr:S1 family peptidase [Defluviitaleaceae bacterium]
MQRKIISLFLVIILALSAFTLVQASSLEQVPMHGGLTLEEQMVIDAELDALFGEGYATNRREAEYYFELMYSGFMRNRSGDVISPDFYGGSYVGEDGSMVLLIVESRLECAYSHDTIGMLLHAGVNYRLVEFSHSDLFAVQETINEIISERFVVLDERHLRDDWCIYANNVPFFFVNVMSNNVMVHLIEYNEDMIAGFRRYVYDSPMLAFGQGAWFTIGGGEQSLASYFCSNCDDGYSNCDMCDYRYLEQENEINEMISPANAGLLQVHPGSGIRTRATGIQQRYVTGTVGFRVRCANTGLRGFIASAHVFSNGADVLTRGLFTGTHIGTTRMGILSSTMDAAFIALQPQITTTNLLPNNQQLSPLVATARIGDPISAAGATTGGIRNSTVFTLNSWIRCSIRGHQFSGMTMAHMHTRDGDSGGTVFAPAARTTLGIMVASGFDPVENAYVMGFVPAVRIFQDFQSRGLNLERY